MSDVQPFKHGEEQTHWVCNARIAKEGGKATCCECNPHEGCGEVVKDNPESPQNTGV
ncbi:MAG: hypothetical protein KGJ90_02040 [Patescibacteria group bacterium]|nr:hypothetical protein [Patescibacteria group bacterium]